jgi:CheY-like chemotaxis protein
MPVTVVFVEDDPLISMAGVDLLEGLGFIVIEAPSGAKALDILRSRSDIDLIVTDHSMPEMTGVELASKARELRPGLPVLLVTGHVHLPEAAAQGIPQLGKPYTQAQLHGALAKLLADNGLPSLQKPDV